MDTFVASIATSFALHWGVYKFFNYAEGLLTRGMKDAIALWVLDANPFNRVKNWPDTCANLFDIFFTKRHLSFPCFWRSCIASLAGVTFFAVLATLNGGWGEVLIRTDDGRVLVSVTTWRVFWIVAFNIPFDYLSFGETRYVIRLMGNYRSTPLMVALLVIDAIATIVIFAAGFASAATLLTRIFNLMLDIPTFQRPSASLFIGARAR